MTTAIQIELNSANGPKVVAPKSASAEEILAALPQGWTVHDDDWTNQVDCGSDYAYPLSRTPAQLPSEEPIPDGFNVWWFPKENGHLGFHPEEHGRCVATAETLDEAWTLLNRLGASQIQEGLDGDVHNP